MSEDWIADANADKARKSYPIDSFHMFCAQDSPEALRLVDQVRLLTEQNRKLKEELETYRRDPVHVIELRDDGFTIQHPLSCRPNLFDCIYNYAAANMPELGQHSNGRFKVTVEGDELIIGEEA